jgi:hypothetical protein
MWDKERGKGKGREGMGGRGEGGISFVVVI